MKYKTLSETIREIIIIDNMVEVRWNGRNKDHYIDKGYTFTALHKTFLCKVSDLLTGTHIKVLVKCPNCGECKTTSYYSIAKQGNTLCTGCSKTADLRGMKFGRWTVIGYDGSVQGVNRGASWKCKCECETERDVAARLLISGESTSCGCYNREQSSLRRGELSPNWNPDLTDEERIINRDYREYAHWVKQVYERDYFACVVCNSRKSIHAHHLYSHDAYPEYRLIPEYGITLCKKHHQEFHLWLGGYRVICIPSDFDRWIYETQ